ncbi:hypothetical protein HAX54_010158, partial [Datura stramonium]|nr:hypothetical protein [Datura stramonium]
AIGEEIKVLSLEDNLSVRNLVIEEESILKIEVGEVNNGVSSVAAEENAQTWISKSENKEKVDEKEWPKKIDVFILQWGCKNNGESSSWHNRWIFKSNGSRNGPNMDWWKKNSSSPSTLSKFPLPTSL